MDIQQLKQFKILLLGETCKDVYHYGSCDRLNPEAPVPILREEKIEVKPGMAANVKANLEAFELNIDHFTNLNEIEKHRLIDNKFNCHLARYDVGEAEPLPPLERELHGYDMLVISDYDKGLITPEYAEKMCSLYTGKPIFVDSKKSDLSCFKNAIIKINELENEQKTNIDESCELIVTLGSKGALYNDNIYKTEKTEVFDVCGAGDVFLSALVFGKIWYNDIPKAIKLANKLASKSVTKTGTYIIKKEDYSDEVCF